MTTKDTIELQIAEHGEETHTYCYDNPVKLEDETDDELEEERAMNLIDDACRMEIGLPLSQPKSTSNGKYSKALKTFKPFRGKGPKDVLPINKAGLFSYMTFSWLTSFMTAARKSGTVEMNQMWKISPEESADGNIGRLERLWKEELAAKGQEKASFQRVWFRFVRTRYIAANFVLAFSLACNFVGSAYIVQEILSYLELEDGADGKQLWKGLVLVGGMFLADGMRTVLMATTWSIMYQIGVRFRGAVIALVYKHLLTLKSTKTKSIGELVNICVNDSQRLFEATAFMVMLLGGPLAFIVSLVYGYYILGPWSFLGNFVFILFYPIQAGISKLTTDLRQKVITITDKRVKKMTEVLNNIKFIKMYAWEPTFITSVRGLRKDEKRRLEQAGYVQSLSNSITPLVPILAAVVTFIGHTLTGNDLTASQAFTMLNLFTVLRNAITIVPTCVRNLSEARVSFERVKRFLLLESHQLKSNTSTSLKCEQAIRVSNCTFSWNGDNSATSSTSKNAVSNGTNYTPDERERLEDVNILTNIDMQVAKGNLVGICGPVGSGKTSLFSALLGQMEMVKGDRDKHLHIKGKIAYATQSAWIFNETVKENILFGSNYNEKWYKRVLKACCLEDDLKSFPAGDETEIGERGANLSGGQKQRINLARAVYSNRDIVLLDDPLSAVDAEVGNHIFKDCIQGLLAGKTVLLVTNHLQFIKLCDHVILMNDGRIKEQGHHATLMESNQTYSKMMAKWKPDGVESTTKITKETIKSEKSKTSKPGSSRDQDRTKGKGALVAAEKKKSGSVSHKVYRSYVRAAGGVCVTFSVILLFVLYISITAFSLWWLSHWISEGNGMVVLVDNATVSDSTSLPSFDHDMFKRSVDNTTAVEHTYSTNTPGLTAMFNTTDLERTQYSTNTPGLNAMFNTTDLERTQYSTNTPPAFTSNFSTTGNEITPELTKTSSVVSNYTISTAEENTTHFITHTVENLTSAVSTFSTPVLTNFSITDSFTTESATITSSAYYTSTSVPSNSITDNPQLHEYVLIYGMTIVAMLVVALFKGFIFVKSTLHASSKLHSNVLNCVLKSPMSFFDTNPVGRVINRFSKDLDEVDSRLPFIMEAFLHQALLILAAIIIITINFPLFLIALIPVSIAFYILNKWSIIGIRQFKRLDNISRSSILSHLTATTEGLPVIQAYNGEKRMEKKFKDALDRNSVPFYLFHCGMRWFTLRLDVMGVVLTSFAALLVVLSSFFVEFGRSDAALAGLSLSYAIQLTGYFQFTARLKSEVEALFTSVERFQEYTEKLKPEAPSVIRNNRPPSNWPNQGHVSFNNVNMRYRDDLPPTLKDLVLDINPKEKLGVVGRTGAGKSSLAVSLFRLVEPMSGSIVIDNVDIAHIGLQDLRSRLSILPQDPVLLAGSVRYNLDPFNLYGDESIWRALEDAHIKDKINRLPQKLSAEIEENGRNFSVGERQLLCMARALLRRSKILVFDEPTAAVDAKTDAKIQKTIREAFKDCTVITIAHRMNTILDSDRILVMDNGKIIEIGSPAELLKNPDSHLFSSISNEDLERLKREQSADCGTNNKDIEISHL